MTRLDCFEWACARPAHTAPGDYRFSIERPGQVDANGRATSPFLDLACDGGEKRTGSVAGPRRNNPTSGGGVSPASRRSGSASRMRFSATSISKRDSTAPRQKCRPPPNARWAACARERALRVGLGPVQVEAIGIGEAALVAVGRAQEAHDLGARGQDAAGDLDLLAGLARHHVGRRGVAERLGDRARQQRPVLPHGGQRVGMREQVAQRGRRAPSRWFRRPRTP